MSAESIFRRRRLSAIPLGAGSRGIPRAEPQSPRSTTKRLRAERSSWQLVTGRKRPGEWDLVLHGDRYCVHRRVGSMAGIPRIARSGEPEPEDVAPFLPTRHQHLAGAADDISIVSLPSTLRQLLRIKTQDVRLRCRCAHDPARIGPCSAVIDSSRGIVGLANRR